MRVTVLLERPLTLLLMLDCDTGGNTRTAPPKRCRSWLLPSMMSAARSCGGGGGSGDQQRKRR